MINNKFLFSQPRRLPFLHLTQNLIGIKKNTILKLYFGFVQIFQKIKSESRGFVRLPYNCKVFFNMGSTNEIME